MKTAMQKLMESFDDYKKESHETSISIDILKRVITTEYLKKEKQQITEAYEEGSLFHEELSA